MRIIFRPSENLWIDLDSGTTGESEKAVRDKVLGVRSDFVNGSIRQFTQPTRSVSSFNLTRRSGSGFPPVPTIASTFGGGK